MRKIVSGGQTGVDRAALRVAAELGIDCGGWCPKGRKSEDGAIPAEFSLIETETDDYSVRTERNVRDADGTLILVIEEPRKGSGTRYTIECAARRQKPCLILDLTSAEPSDLRHWIAEHGIETMNVAGPRESQTPGIEKSAEAFLRRALG